MKTLINDLQVFKFKPVYKETRYPVSIIDENGATHVGHQVIHDNDINPCLSCDDVSLSALVKAGIDPSSMHISTSQSRLDSHTTMVNVIESGLVDSMFEKVEPLNVEPLNPDNNN